MRKGKSLHLLLKAAKIRATYSDLIVCYLLILDYLGNSVGLSSKGEKGIYDKIKQDREVIEKEFVISDAKSQGLKIQVFENAKISSLALIYNLLKEGLPVMIETREDGNTAFKVVSGCLPNGDFIVADPNRRRELVVSHILMALLARLPNGYWFVAISANQKGEML